MRFCKNKRQMFYYWNDKTQKNIRLQENEDVADEVGACLKKSCRSYSRSYGSIRLKITIDSNKRAI